ncbi:sulfatase, partial [bacterium]|nr:sulfatase [bacterium]
DPSVERNAEGRRIRRRSLDRVSRRVDASGWDRVRSEAITSADASTLELHFLHRTGGADEVVTLIDDVTVSITPLEESAYLDYLTGRYKPRDGQESLTPWRLRVSLQSEVRDSVLVRAGGELAFDLEVPPAESAPQLRFGVAALPETSRESGDGATMSAWFIDAEVETAGKQAGEAELAQGLGALELGSVTVDAKNDRDQRVWREVTFDLSAAAGRTGTLAFRVTDVDDQPDALDALLVGTPRIEPRDEPPTAPNILLIGVDTLRADHMSAFGYERDTTPNLKALADEGVRFDMARSPAPWTLPSFSSMLTSLYPSAHGAGRGGHDEWEAIDPTTVSVAEVLARNGYETAGIVANGLISPRYGLDQGFDRYRAQWAMESVEKDAPRVAEFIDGHRATPWLMFWHIMDPHLPYTTPAETRERFTDANYDGRFAEGGRGGPTVPFQVLDPRPGRRWYAHEGPPPAPDLTEADARYVGDYYDAEIAEMDAGIGVVLEAVRASGQWDRTIVAFVADHGEGLGDHNHYHHGYTLFDDQVHVPMLLRVPGGPAGQVIERPVSTVDLMPTLLGQLGIPTPEDAQGVDRLAPDAPAVDATFIEYPTYDSSAQKAWVEGPFKYLWDPLYQTEALYDFVADPAELVDVKDQHPEVVARAREALREFRLAHLSAGRFHLRVRGTKGQRLQLRVSTDDLFDANFITRPALPPDAFEMDLDRSYLALDTVLEN